MGGALGIAQIRKVRKKSTLNPDASLQRGAINKATVTTSAKDLAANASEVIAAGWPWASGGIVFTPADLNDFIRGYVGGDLFDPRTRAQQRRHLAGGRSDPIGPGMNSAGLGIFRYATHCGTVWGHTGSFPGYTQFMAASPDPTRSVVVSVNEQLMPKDRAPGVFPALRAAERRAVCAALGAE